MEIDPNKPFLSKAEIRRHIKACIEKTLMYENGVHPQESCLALRVHLEAVIARLLKDDDRALHWGDHFERLFERKIRDPQKPQPTAQWFQNLQRPNRLHRRGTLQVVEQTEEFEADRDDGAIDYRREICIRAIECLERKLGGGDLEPYFKLIQQDAENEEQPTNDGHAKKAKRAGSSVRLVRRRDYDQVRELIPELEGKSDSTCKNKIDSNKRRLRKALEKCLVSISSDDFWFSDDDFGTVYDMKNEFTEDKVRLVNNQAIHENLPEAQPLLDLIGRASEQAHTAAEFARLVVDGIDFGLAGLNDQDDDLDFSNLRFRLLVVEEVAGERAAGVAGAERHRECKLRDGPVCVYFVPHTDVDEASFSIDIHGLSREEIEELVIRISFENEAPMILLGRDIGRQSRPWLFEGLPLPGGHLLAVEFGRLA